jgi:hypothetical protein
MVIALTACGADTIVTEVEPGTYTARVPTSDQLAAPGAGALPGSFADLREAGVDRLEVEVADDEVSIAIDGETVATRAIAERVQALAQEGDEAFQSRIEAVVLRLGGGALEIGGASFDQPAVVPGRATGSALVALRSWGGETPVALGCLYTTPCLLATTGSEPSGSYESTAPEDAAAPVTEIEVRGEDLELRLASGTSVEATRPADPERATTAACGITVTAIWEVPDEAGLGMDDPVVVDTSCLGEAAGSYLTLMERADIPVLASWGNPVWCERGPIDAAEEGVPPECFVFARPE